MNSNWYDNVGIEFAGDKITVTSVLVYSARSKLGFDLRNPKRNILRLKFGQFWGNFVKHRHRIRLSIFSYTVS